MSKFRKPTSPAFNVGELWIGSKEIEVRILSVTRFGEGKWDYWIEYASVDGRLHKKDAWNFQVRYEHWSDTKEYCK